MTNMKEILKFQFKKKNDHFEMKNDGEVLCSFRFKAKFFQIE